MTGTQKQHVDLYRKLILRRSLIEKMGHRPQKAYVPFIGDGDIAAGAYPSIAIFGADVDGERVKTAKERLPQALIVEADCDKRFPFPGEDGFDLAYFDAYGYPYKAFRLFWESGKVISPCLVLFTDGQKQAIIRTGHWRNPDGKRIFDKTLTARRKSYNGYYNLVSAWLVEYVKPWIVREVRKYQRKQQLYWGAIIEKPEEVIECDSLGVFGSRTLDDGRVEDVLVAEIERYKIKRIVTAGEIKGVSEVARGLARRLSLQLLECFLEEKYAQGMYDHRSRAIIKEVGRIILIHDGQSSGTQNEYDIVKELKVPHNYYRLAILGEEKEPEVGGGGNNVPITDSAKKAHYQKFDIIKKAAYLKAVASGKSFTLAAESVGVHYQTVRNHIKRYPGFRAKISEAELRAIQGVEWALYEAASSGNLTAIIFYLQNRAPESWRDMRNVRQEISGPDGGPIQQEIKGRVIQFGAAELAEAYRILADSGVLRLAKPPGGTEVDELHTP